MKTTKDKNLAQGISKDKINFWKDKSKVQNQENKYLKQRVKELTESRNLWKNKYKTLRHSIQVSPKTDTRKAKHHRHELWLILLVISWYGYGTMSLRSCRHSLAKMIVILGFSVQVPSHSTIRNWLCKMGHYQLESSQKEQGNWVVFIDESIVFGSDKILLILGLEESKINQDAALLHSDVEVLYVGVGKEWKSEQISQRIACIGEQKSISYVVSDSGRNLIKCYDSSDYEHIPDITHVLANVLKRLYSSDEAFIAFKKMIGKARKLWYLSADKSIYLPPKMRIKLRFANIFPSVNWAMKMLREWDRLSEEVQKELLFLKQNEAFMEELFYIGEGFKMTCEILKKEGFGESQKAKILQSLAQLNQSEKMQIFHKDIKEYLDTLSQKASQLKQTYLVCSSDIIESFFGKFKLKTTANNQNRLTEFVFTIANFSKNFTTDEVKEALEFSKVRDLKNLFKANNSS